MKKQIKASYYYDYSKVFSFGKNNIVVVGTRGHGKSYGIKDIGLKYSIKIHELGMIWIRRFISSSKRLKYSVDLDNLLTTETIVGKTSKYLTVGGWIYSYESSSSYTYLYLASSDNKVLITIMRQSYGSDSSGTWWPVSVGSKLYQEGTGTTTYKIYGRK